jgi:hypothetical protein
MRSQASSSQATVETNDKADQQKLQKVWRRQDQCTKYLTEGEGREYAKYDIKYVPGKLADICLEQSRQNPMLQSWWHRQFVISSALKNMTLLELNATFGISILFVPTWRRMLRKWC